MNFEEGIKELEKIVSTLEKEELSLEKSVELYSEGMKLSVMCKKELEKAKLKMSEYNSST